MIKVKRGVKRGMVEFERSFFCYDNMLLSGSTPVLGYH